MADPQTDPHDDKVRTVPLPSDEPGEADQVIVQENQSAEVAIGGGGWPSPHAPPTGPAPGQGGGDDAGLSRENEAGDFPPMKDVLDADPLAGGSRSQPADDDGAGDDQRWGGSHLP